MKTENDIQRAHDQLWPIVAGEVPFHLPPEVMKALRPSLCVLCWILEHEESTVFQEMLDELLAIAEMHGLRLKEYPDGKALPRKP